MELDPFHGLDNDGPVTPSGEEPRSDAQLVGGGNGSTNVEDPVASLTSNSNNEAVAPPPATVAQSTPVQPKEEVEPSSLKPQSRGSSTALPAVSKSKAAPSAVASTTSGKKSGVPSSGKSSASPEDLQEELANLLIAKQLPQTTVTALQNLLRENANLKEKNSKLKSLLGRSAKAQRDAKNELEQMKKLYESTKNEADRLEKRVEVLANRPTHMDLLADFETNFDRALLSIGGGDKKSGGQSGGENAAESSSPSGMVDTSTADTTGGISLYDDITTTTTSRHGIKNNNSSSSRSDSLLLTELNEAKSRIAHLESLNTSFQGRYNNLEHTHKALLNDQQVTKNTLTNLQLELRMSKMETEHALRSLREKEAIVTEMQLEINLVTQSAVEANKRAAEGMEVARSAKSDREYVDGLEAKVVALQEWALASTESKRLTTERCRGLEGRVKELEEVVKNLTSSGGSGADDGLLLTGDGDNIVEGMSDLTKATIPKPINNNASTASSLAGTTDGNHERKLWSKSSSLVVGAGMVGHAFLELGQVHIEPYETVILRWKFDLTPGDLDIYFSVLKGICEDKKKQRVADACFRHRHVKGGGGGDVSGAFAKQNACTLVWSNEMSWVRPRTIKWTVDAMAIEWSD